MKNFSQTFKVRASEIGQIMTNSRDKSETLSETCKTYLQEKAKEAIYGRKKSVQTKYMDKGLIVEDNALDFLSKWYNTLLIKNEKQYVNDYITGTPDHVKPLIDVKCSWDCFTFPLFDEKINKAYYWQLQGYMALTGEETAELVYLLMDTPEHIVDKEYHWHCVNNGYDPDDFEVKMEFYDYHKYDKVDDKYRMKRYVITRNDNDIEAIYNRVKECREYLGGLIG